MTGQAHTARGRPRDVRLASYPTFDSGFEHGIDTAKWPDTGYPWIEDVVGRGRQLAIGEERQYYVTRSELMEHQSYRPWFTNVDGHLVLRCQPTPVRYRSTAYAVLDTYPIVAIDKPGRRVTIEGRPWLELATGLVRNGVHRELRDNPNLPGASYLVIGGERFAYLRIVSEPVEDPSVSIGLPTRHVIELLERVPDTLPVAPGRSTLTLLRRQPAVSGMLTTRGAFAQRFGSVHARMRLPTGRGTLAGVLVWSLPDVSSPGDSAVGVGGTNGVSLLEQPGHGGPYYQGFHLPGDEYPFGSAMSGPSAHLQHPISLGALADHDVACTGPGDSGHVDARKGWVEVIWDWYPDDTCAWFVKVDGAFVETARMRMPAGPAFGLPVPRMIVIRNAIDSRFNRACELRDAPDGVVEQLRSVPPWDLEVAFVRASQWAGYPPLPPEPGSGIASRLPVRDTQPTYRPPSPSARVSA